MSHHLTKFQTEFCDLFKKSFFLFVSKGVINFFLRQGDVESAMKYLEMFVELADRSQQLPEQQRACTSLGSIYNSMVRQHICTLLYSCNILCFLISCSFKCK